MLDGLLGATFYGQEGPYLYRGSNSRANYNATSNAEYTAAGNVESFGHAIDFVNKTYYVLKNDQRSILKSNLGLQNVSTVFTLDAAYLSTRCLAVHPWTSTVFYGAAKLADSIARIRRVGFDGTGDADVVTVAAGYSFEADGVCVSKDAGYLFYFIGNPPAVEIRRCRLDGSGDTLLYGTSDLTFGAPREISIDNTNQRIYWDGGFTKIYSLPFAGGTPTLLAEQYVAPLPASDGGPGNRYIIHNGTFSHKRNRLFFNLSGGAAPHDPTNLGLWSMNPDGSDIKAEIVYPNIIDSVTRLPSQPALSTGRWRLGAGFETTGSATNAS